MINLHAVGYTAEGGTGMNDYISREAAMDCLTGEVPETADETIRRTIRRLRDLPAADVASAQRWIPVTERIPKDGTHCLAFYAGLITTLSYRDEYGFCTFDFEWGTYSTYPDVTHWMPLPEPPNTDIEEDNHE